jgi:carbon storage regulator
MLVLTRRAGQSMTINGDTTVTVLKTHANIVRIGIEAPASVEILRGEAKVKSRKPGAKMIIGGTEENGLPEIMENRKHWKVGDGVEFADGERFVIGQMALIQLGEDTEHMELAYYDERGILRMTQSLTLDKVGNA